MRPGESQMNPYVFISPSEFEQMISDGKFLEWKKIHTNDYYGTHLPTIEYAIENGYDIITDMDVLGCEDAMLTFPNHICTIFITPPSIDELSHRLLNRDSDQNAVKRRLERVPLELQYVEKYDFSLVNDNLDQSTLELQRIIQMVVNGEWTLNKGAGEGSVPNPTR